jgi:chromosome segregation ATPase
VSKKRIKELSDAINLKLTDRETVDEAIHTLRDRLGALNERRRAMTRDIGALQQELLGLRRSKSCP